MKSYDLIDNVPIYARSLDRRGVLEHFANGLQPQIDAILRNLDIRDVFFDPRVCPEKFLPFLGQFWGLANEGDHWLGIGLNPAWSQAHARKVIERIPQYWARKGTNWAVREAIALWLQWEPAHSDRLLINLPFGDSPTAYPPQWLNFNSVYNSYLNQTYAEREHYASGDYPQIYRPAFEVLQGEEQIQEQYALWSDRVLELIPAPEIETTGSALGPERPWMHLSLYEIEWKTVVPDIVKLNPEIWSSFAEPEVFAWLSYRLRNPLTLTPSDSGGHFRIDEYLTYDGFQYGDLWHYSAGEPIVDVSTIEKSEFFELAPGHGYSDLWNAPDFPTEDQYLYYAPGQRRYFNESVESLEFRPCHSGFVASIQTGEKQDLLGGESLIPASQIVSFFPGFNLIIEVPPIAVRPSTQSNALVLPSINLDLIPSISTRFTASLDLPASSVNVRAIAPVFNNLPRLSALEVPQIPSEDTYLLVPPLDISLYRDVWNNGHQYYYSGKPEVPGAISTVPIFEDHPLCNLADQYSMKLIERRLVNVPLPLEIVDLFEGYPLLGKVSTGENWRLLVETTERLYLLKPVTFFWSNKLGSGNLEDRSQSLDMESEPKSLYLEFVFCPLQDGFLIGHSLLLDHECLQSHQTIEPLPINTNINVGIRIAVPFVLESEALTFDQDREISEALPILWQDMIEIKRVANSFMINPLELPSDAATPPNTLRTLLQNTHTQMLEVLQELSTIAPIMKQIFCISLSNGIAQVIDGIWETEFIVSTGIGNQNYGVGEFQSTEIGLLEISRPAVERVGIDSFKLTFLDDQAIQNNSVSVWIYQATRQPF